MITCRQAHHLSDTFLLGNHLERVKSSNEFYYSKFFYILFTTVKAFYQRQIPSVATANIRSGILCKKYDLSNVKIFQKNSLFHPEMILRRTFIFL